MISLKNGKKKAEEEEKNLDGGLKIYESNSVYEYYNIKRRKKV